MTLPFQTLCPCGKQLTAGIKKPTRFEFSTVKIVCPTCKSRYLISCEVDKDKRPRSYVSHIVVIELGELAKEAIEARVGETRDEIKFENENSNLGEN